MHRFDEIHLFAVGALVFQGLLDGVLELADALRLHEVLEGLHAVLAQVGVLLRFGNHRGCIVHGTVVMHFVLYFDLLDEVQSASQGEVLDSFRHLDSDGPEGVVVPLNAELLLGDRVEELDLSEAIVLALPGRYSAHGKQWRAVPTGNQGDAVRVAGGYQLRFAVTLQDTFHVVQDVGLFLVLDPHQVDEDHRTGVEVLVQVPHRLRFQGQVLPAELELVLPGNPALFFQEILQGYALQLLGKQTTAEFQYRILEDRPVVVVKTPFLVHVKVVGSDDDRLVLLDFSHRLAVETPHVLDVHHGIVQQPVALPFFEKVPGEVDGNASLAILFPLENQVILEVPKVFFVVADLFGGFDQELQGHDPALRLYLVDARRVDALDVLLQKFHHRGFTAEQEELLALFLHVGIGYGGAV